MATFLELAKSLARESGSFDPSSLTGVSGLTGRPEKVVNWINRAWLNIQNSRRDWGWLVSPFEVDLIPGSSVYTPASFNLTRFSSWMKDYCGYQPLTIYDPLIGQSDETALLFIPYEWWQTKWNRGDQTNWNRPIEYSISPRNELVFGPIPDQTYVVRGQYQKGPQTLEAANDVPEMPARFHDMIVWEGMRLMMVSDGDYQESQYPTMEMVGLRHELELDQLPEITVP
jgi:hypothetical protein